MIVAVEHRRTAGVQCRVTPCGICQEQLAHWGGDVQVAVPDPHDFTRWLSKPLREVQPYYCAKILENF